VMFDAFVLALRSRTASILLSSMVEFYKKQKNSVQRPLHLFCSKRRGHAMCLAISVWDHHWSVCQKKTIGRRPPNSMLWMRALYLFLCN
jgi:hypothetical protein